MTLKIITFELHERIASTYIRNEFMWDIMADVDWDILRGCYASAEHVCATPSRFPNADFEALEERLEKVGDFLHLHMQEAR